MRTLWRTAVAAGAGAGASQALLASPQSAVGEAAPEDVVSVARLSSAEEGLERIPWREEGYLSWKYDGYNINYVDEGDKDKVRGAGQGGAYTLYFGFIVFGRANL